VRAQQPAQIQIAPEIAQNATLANEPKEVLNEKTGQPPYQETPAIEPAILSPENGKPLQGDATVDRPIAIPPESVPATQPNAAVIPISEKSQGLESEPPITQAPMIEPPHVAQTTTSRDDPTTTHIAQFIAPTTTLPSAEDDVILDRTPEQAARDTDIEMSDAGPSLPLSAQDAALVVEEERIANQQRESTLISQDDLPPPPPLQDREDQAVHDGTAQSQDTSMMSTPEPQPPPKWLLPPLRSELEGRKCLVLDLDETLVHSSFKVSLHHLVQNEMCSIVVNAEFRFSTKRTSRSPSR